MNHHYDSSCTAKVTTSTNSVQLHQTVATTVRTGVGSTAGSTMKKNSTRKTLGIPPAATQRLSLEGREICGVNTQMLAILCLEFGQGLRYWQKGTDGQFIYWLKDTHSLELC